MIQFLPSKTLNTLTASSVGTIRDGAAVLTGKEAHWPKPGPPIEHQRKNRKDGMKL